jgi:hypothetical protein
VLTRVLLSRRFLTVLFLTTIVAVTAALSVVIAVNPSAELVGAVLASMSLVIAMSAFFFAFAGHHASSASGRAIVEQLARIRELLEAQAATDERRSQPARSGVERPHAG